MTQNSDLKLPSRMHGGIAGMLITLIVIAAVGGATYFAVSSMLGSDNGEDAPQAADTQGLTKADAQRIGREEGAKVARDIAYQAALDVAQASGGAALYGDSYASAETTDYGSYGSESDSADATDTSDTSASDYGDYGDYDSSAADEAYAAYTSGSDADTTSSSGASGDAASSETSTASAYDDDDASSASSDAYSDYGDSSGSASTDDYLSEDYGLDDDTETTNTSSSTNTAAASKPAARSAPKEPEPVVQAKAPPPATALKPWWPPAKDQSSGAMRILYVGTFAGDAGKGIGVLFGDAVKSGQNYGDFVKVVDDNGKAVSVTWTTANNPALLKTGALKGGRYLVQLKPGLQSAQGRTQSLTLEGPVFID